ncbi:acyl-CoA dehydrogenase family protein [Pseudomonas aeruginosa]
MSAFEFKEPGIVSEELRMLRDQARRFVTEVVEPNGEQWERDGCVPRSVFRQLGELGLLGVRFPVEYDGSELGPLASVVMAEELSRSSFGGFASSVNVHTDMSLACGFRSTVTGRFG